MFEKLREKLRKNPTFRIFDPLTLSDPIAEKTSWSSLTKIPSRTRSHKLISVSSDYLKFEIMVSHILLYFCGMFVCVLVFLQNNPLDSGSITFAAFLWKPILAMSFFVLFLSRLNYKTRPVYFHKEKNIFKGSNKEKCYLTDIYALQIIARYIGSRVPYYNFEVNLVLTDGERLSVINHGNVEWVRSDVKNLSKFLEVPIWNLESVR